MDENRYAHLASWYDWLFPLDPDALSLVVLLAGDPKGQSIVDAGCGTGTMAKALGRAGYRVHGFDLDDSLLALALSPPAVTGVSFTLGDLRTYVLPDDLEPPQLVVCLGNTLPHLLTEVEVAGFFQRTRRALSPNGRFLIQTLNYRHLEATRLYELPVREVQGTRFSRRYVPTDSGLWQFQTSLAGPWGQSIGEFPLRPWKQEELEKALSLNGFRVEAAWGGFDRRAVDGALPLVISARVS